MKQFFLAIDIGASSGRLMLGSFGESRILELEEIHRFSNGAVRRGGNLCWEYDRIFEEIKTGMKKCAELGKIPTSVGVDTWGVDFVLLDKDGKLIGDSVAYRDSRTQGVPERISEIIPETELYARTGMQKQPFNTIYQLFTVPEQLEKAETYLMAPEYFHYLLTGSAVNEYTISTTTGLVNAEKRTWDWELIQRLGYPEKLFKPLHMPGESVGILRDELSRELGFDCRVVLPATHDTGSAVAAAPLDSESIYISSGTWSLIGVESRAPFTTQESLSRNFTNEGGVDYRFRYLKNIMGLWMIQEVRRELGEKYSYAELAQMAEGEDGFPSIVDVESFEYLAPESMSAAIRDECRRTGQSIPETPAQLAACIFKSLAAGYNKAVLELQEITGRRFKRLCIVGGGCKNDYLNRLAARTTGLEVTAGPSEATALGNIAVQMMAAGAVSGIEEAREIIKNSFSIQRINP